ncbi:MAG: hypothetical protein M1823_004181 [Watsoniomyces obsoletus]|nr:MAG: hypothetical protein M1823_004181 [Watsoniomyces obsoletus]
MARRRTKKRTHLQARNGAGPNKNGGVASTTDKIPKSMVLRMGAGEVGPSVSQLVKDVRAMMEPNTASRLKERRSNKLKDYTTMAGPLGVSHLLLFSRSDAGNINLRIALAPRGPTFFFNVETYSLCKDIQKSMKHPKTPGKEMLNPPLLVMNNFLSSNNSSSSSTQPAVPKHLETLTTSMFQSLFPPISPQDTSLSSLRRVLLLNRETIANPGKEGSKGNYIINLRHYAITTRRTGISKRVRRLRTNDKLMRSRDKKHRGIPDLGKLEDMADYFLDRDRGEGGSGSGSGYVSASESEGGMTDAEEVEVLETPMERRIIPNQSMKRATNPEADGDVESMDLGPETERRQEQGRELVGGRGRVEKRAIKLEEIGPRIRLRLIKVEEGLCGGRVMWHDFITKSKVEEKKMDELWEERRKLKEKRRKEQNENVERKKKEKGESGGGGGKGGDGHDGEWDDDEIEQFLNDDEDEQGEEHGDENGEGEEEEDAWEGVEGGDDDTMEVDQD